MAIGPYDTHSADDARLADEPRDRSLGEHVFIWIAWALAAAFWGMTMTTIGGIISSVMQPSPGPSGGADAGGIGFLLMDVIGGMLLLGGAMAYASWMFARRNRALDPASEAATAALYDRIERQGGEDMTRRSPDRERAGREFR